MGVINLTPNSSRSCVITVQGRQLPVWVNLDTFGRGDAAIPVRYTSNSDQGGESQRNVAKCHEPTSSP
jgi:hypothetical protein